MSDSDPVSSADQDAWVSLPPAARVELAKQIPLMGAMKVEELKTFMDAIHAGMFSHFQAMTFDKQVELELRKITAD